MVGIAGTSSARHRGAAPTAVGARRLHPGRQRGQRWRRVLLSTATLLGGRQPLRLRADAQSGGSEVRVTSRRGRRVELARRPARDPRPRAGGSPYGASGADATAPRPSTGGRGGPPTRSSDFTSAPGRGRWRLPRRGWRGRHLDDFPARRGVRRRRRRGLRGRGVTDVVGAAGVQSGDGAITLSYSNLPAHTVSFTSSFVGASVVRKSRNVSAESSAPESRRPSASTRAPRTARAASTASP